MSNVENVTENASQSASTSASTSAAKSGAKSTPKSTNKNAAKGATNNEIANGIEAMSTRFIVPFYLDIAAEDGYEDIVRRIKGIKEPGESGKGKWLIYKYNDISSRQDVDERDREVDVYKVVQDSFVDNEMNSNLGCEFRLNRACYEDMKIRFNSFQGKLIEFGFGEVGLFVFRSGVAFLWYDVKFGENTIPETHLLHFINKFKELSFKKYTQKDNYGKFAFVRVEDGQPVDEGFLMGDWITRSVLTELSEAITYFASKTNPLDVEKRIPDKAIIFNYIVFKHNKDKEEFFKQVYLLNNGFNYRYNVYKGCERLYYQSFENIYYYASMHGCGYYSIASKDDKNVLGSYIRTNFLRDYFHCYILALFQSYSLHRFTVEMESTLSAKESDYMRENGEMLSRLKMLSTRINLFLIKSVYSTVSQVMTQDSFYVYVVEQLRIRENISSLTIGLDSFERILEGQYKEDERKARETALEAEKLSEEKESMEREIGDKRIELGLGCLSILAVISAIADGFSSGEGLFALLNPNMAYKWSLFRWICSVASQFDISANDISGVLIFVSLLVFCVALVTIITSLRNFRKLKKKYNEFLRESRENVN